MAEDDNFAFQKYNPECLQRIFKKHTCVSLRIPRTYMYNMRPSFTFTTINNFVNTSSLKSRKVVALLGRVLLLQKVWFIPFFSRIGAPSTAEYRNCSTSPDQRKWRICHELTRSIFLAWTLPTCYYMWCAMMRIIYFHKCKICSIYNFTIPILWAWRPDLNIGSDNLASLRKKQQHECVSNRPNCPRWPHSQANDGLIWYQTMKNSIQHISLSLKP